ncbi:hypothetical protein C7H19_12465 [Aphanothece hegewaldii CCALA 016]|uniref:Uncharacterized protein n=1 Tax=Aphanothece hegewaldii CCALA 016 TaxID=2107694 RepID=A0A2T1LX66_9CHRO|nr:hypothetical protein [Aphanothece hegewaldii]PSF36777.1 hypothetical protein C7H19_12465 [Aphanothece hegewaldii CCALA 016]
MTLTLINLIETIKNAYYMPPVISKIDKILENREQKIYEDAFNELHDIIQNSKQEVQKLIEYYSIS